MGRFCQPLDDALQARHRGRPRQPLQRVNPEPDQAVDEVVVVPPRRFGDVLRQRFIDLVVDILAVGRQKPIAHVRCRPTHTR